MFTGIVQGIAKIASISKKSNFYTHIVEFPDYMLENIEIGSSVSYNGCCVTIVKIDNNYISFDLIKETLHITNLSELLPGDIVNIERSIKFHSELGGHLMSGHVVNTAEIIKILSSEDNYQIWFKPKDLSIMKYILYKGYIGIDGISLTVGKVKEEYFCVHFIPETLRRTTIKKKNLKQSVNIEIDSKTQAIVDTVERVLSSREIIRNYLVKIIQ